MARAQERQRVHIIDFESSPRQQAIKQVLDAHRRWEFNAVWAARKVTNRLTNAGVRELAQDEAFLDAMALAFYVEKNHVALFKALVREMVKYDPVRRQQMSKRGRKQWESLEMQAAKANSVRKGG